MNFRDFAIARKRVQTEKSHTAINRQKAKRPLARPRATKNISAPNNPQMQGIQLIAINLNSNKYYGH